MKKIVYVDMDDVLCKFSESKEKHLKDTPEISYPQCKMDFFRKLLPVKYAIESFNYLSGQFDVYILTAPSVMNPMSYTEKRLWVEDHFGIKMTEKLIICKNKALLKGDYLIDDQTDGCGQENFEGELLTFGSKRFPDWAHVLDYLMESNLE